MVGGLADETVQGWDREVDPILEPEPIGASVMFEDNTDNDDDDEWS